MVLSVQRGATQYISGTPLKERLLRYFEKKTLNCPHIKKLRPREVLIQCVQSFPIKMTYWVVVSSIQGLFNKIPVLFLQIQGVFKEKVIFKEFSRT